MGIVQRQWWTPHAQRIAQHLSISLAMLAALVLVEGLILWRLGIQVLPGFSSSSRTVSRFALRADGGGVALFRYFGRPFEPSWIEAVVFSPTQWETCRKLDCLGHTANEIACSPVSRHVAVGCTDGTVLLYDDANNPTALEWRCARAIDWIVFSPNGQLLATIGETVYVHDLDAGGATRRMAAGGPRLTCAAFASDSGAVIAGSADGDISLWDAATGEHLRRIGTHGAHVMQIVLSPDGGLLASTSDDRHLRMWDMETGKQLWSKPIPAFSYLPMDFSADGRVFAAGCVDRSHGDNVSLFEAATGLCRERYSLDAGPIEVEFSPDGQLYARTDDSALHRLSLGEVSSSWQLIRAATTDEPSTILGVAP